MPRQKLVKVNEKYTTNAEKQIKDLIIDTYVKGEFIALSEIQKAFRRDLKLSEGTINNLLKDLLQKGEISTYYENGRRYYGPKKIPVSLKVGIAIGTAVTFFWLVIDMFSLNAILDNYICLGSDLSSIQEISKISTLPFLISSLILVSLFTIIWYFTEKFNRKVYK